MPKVPKDTTKYLLQSTANKERLDNSIAQIGGCQRITSADTNLLVSPSDFSYLQEYITSTKKQDLVKLLAQLMNLKDIEVDSASVKITDEGFVWAACRIKTYSSPLTEESINDTLTKAGLNDWKWEWTPSAEVYLTSLNSFL